MYNDPKLADLYRQWTNEDNEKWQKYVDELTLHINELNAHIDHLQAALLIAGLHIPVRKVGGQARGE